MGSGLHSARWPLGAWFWRSAHRFLQFAESYAKGQRLASEAMIHGTAQILPEARIHNLAGRTECICVGANSVVRGELLVFAHGGRIAIGNDCYIGEGSRVWSAAEVIVGDRVLISHGVNIHDTDSHPVDARERHRHFRDIIERGHPADMPYRIESAPIRIADDAWIGFGASILKGVSIGAASIVAAGSVVTHDVPRGVLVAGNPAKVVKEL